MKNSEFPHASDETNTISRWDGVTELSSERPIKRQTGRIGSTYLNNNPNSSSKIVLNGDQSNTSHKKLGKNPYENMSEKEREELQRYFEKLSEQGFYKIITNWLYEGSKSVPIDDRRDEDRYTPSYILEPIVSIEDQRRMIAEYCNDGRVQKTLSDAHKRLVKAFFESEFVGECFTFCRQRHIDYMAGRLTFTDDNLSKEGILQSIWALDPGFYKSKEAASLITDPDYLHFVYGKKCREKYRKASSKSQDEHKGQVETEEASSYERRIGKILKESLEGELLTTEEILNDPFLRKKHVDRLHHSVANLEIYKTIWRLDGNDFYGSDELKDYLDRIRADNVGILKDVSVDEVEKRVTAMLEGVPDKSIVEILKAYSKDPCYGDDILIRRLLPILGLLNNPPKVSYQYPKDKATGKYNHETNTIIYYRNADQSSPRKFRIPFRQPLTDNLFRRMETIAHEMCHAHQTYGDNIGPGLKNRYERNGKHYIQPKYNYNAYREQLMEVEAAKFGEAFVLRAKAVYEGMRKKRSNHGKK